MKIEINDNPTVKENKTFPKAREGTSRTNYLDKFDILKIGRKPQGCNAMKNIEKKKLKEMLQTYFF